MDLTFEQSIVSAITFAIIAAFDTLHTKHNNNIQSLCQILKKALLAKNSISPLSLLLVHNNLLTNALAPAANDVVGSSKSTLIIDLMSKTFEKRWSWAELSCFNPYLNKTYKKGKIVLVEKNVYYKNVVLFVQFLQSLVTFCGSALIKVNIAILLQGSILE